MLLSFTLSLVLLSSGGAADVCPETRPAVQCRWECTCFRVNGYRCLRYYTEPCAGKACWQCQGKITERARKSCSLGPAVRTCFCKFKRLHRR